MSDRITRKQAESIFNLWLEETHKPKACHKMGQEQEGYGLDYNGTYGGFAIGYYAFGHSHTTYWDENDNARVDPKCRTPLLPTSWITPNRLSAKELYRFIHTLRDIERAEQMRKRDVVPSICAYANQAS